MKTGGRTSTLNERPQSPHLSDRERTVLLLAADGLTDKEISKNLGISLKTVGTYWDRMRHKSSASSRTQVLANFLRIQVADDQQAGRFDRLFATWEEGVWVIGRNGQTHYANQRVAEILELDGQPVDHKKPAELFGPANATRVRSLLNHSKSKPHTVELHARCGPNGLRWLALRAAPFEDERGRFSASVVLVRDITVRKRVEFALDSCESSLNFLMRQCSDLIATFDSEKRLVYVNDAFCKILHAKDHELLGKHVSDLDQQFSPNARWSRGLEKALKSGQDQKLTTSLACVKGKLTTYMVAQPSGDFSPQTVITLTKSVSGPLIFRNPK